MKKYLSILFGFVFLFSIIISPVFSQESNVPYNTTEIGIPVLVKECVDLKYNLKLTDRDIYTKSEVSKLQNFLLSQGYFKESATGYFGLLTTKAVSKFQKANNISPAIGIVGPLTRAKIKALTCEQVLVCPEGTTGTYPNCVKNPVECPAGYYGKYPDCKIAICDYARPPEGCSYVPGPNYNSVNQCGMVLQCVDDVKVCPEGTTGTYPNCIITTTSKPTITLTANPTGVEKGKDTILTWATTNTTSCTATGGWIGTKATSGSQLISNLQTTTTFTLTCVNQSGDKVSKSVDVGVYIVDDFKPSINLISPNGGEIFNPGEEINIKWESKNLGNYGINVGLTYSYREGASKYITSVSKWNIPNTGSTTIKIPSTEELKKLNLFSNKFQIVLIVNEPKNAGINNPTLIYDQTDDFFSINIPCDAGQTGTYPNCVTIITTPKPTVNLTANPTGVEQGKNVTLTWVSKNATSCYSNNWSGTQNLSGGEGNVLVNKPLNGSEVIINMETTKTFGIYCTGLGGQVFESVDVGVYIVDDFPNPVCPTGTTGTYPNCIQPSLPTLTFTSTPSGIEQGKSSTLTWSSTNATSCTATGGWTGTKATSGSQIISNITELTTYTLTCTGPGGGTIAQTEVNVYIVDVFPDRVCPTGTTGTYPNCVVIITPIEDTTVTIKASPSSVPYGGQTTLTWSSTNATSCTASNSWSGSKATSGSVSFGIYVNNSTTYTLTCTGPGGTASASAKVTIASTTNTIYGAGCTSNTGYSATTGQPCSTAVSVASESSVDKTPRIAIWGGKYSQYLNNKGFWVSDLNSSFVHTNEILNFCKKWYPSTTSYTYYKDEFIPNWVNLSTGLVESFSSNHFSYKCVGGIQPVVLGVSTDIENSCTLSSNLAKGKKSEEVRCLQKKLNSKGYKISGTENGRETNEFGYYTMLALKKFQAENSLKADGILGLQTRALLNK